MAAIAFSMFMTLAKVWQSGFSADMAFWARRALAKSVYIYVWYMYGNTKKVKERGPKRANNRINSTSPCL